MFFYNYSECDKKGRKFSIFNLYYNLYLLWILQQKDQWWTWRTIIAYCNLGWIVIQFKPLTLRNRSNWKRKLEIFGQVWKCVDWEKGVKVCTPMNNVAWHSHLRCHFSNLERERRKKMLEKLQRALGNTICRKKNVNHHHLNVCNLQLVDLYIIKINAFGVWKVLTKKSYLESWNIDSNTNSFGMQRI